MDGCICRKEFMVWAVFLGLFCTEFVLSGRFSTNLGVRDLLAATLFLHSSASRAGQIKCPFFLFVQSQTLCCSSHKQTKTSVKTRGTHRTNDTKYSKGKRDEVYRIRDVQIYNQVLNQEEVTHEGFVWTFTQVRIEEFLKQWEHMLPRWNGAVLICTLSLPCLCWITFLQSIRILQHCAHKYL